MKVLVIALLFSTQLQGQYTLQYSREVVRTGFDRVAAKEVFFVIDSNQLAKIEGKDTSTYWIASKQPEPKKIKLLCGGHLKKSLSGGAFFRAKGISYYYDKKGELCR